MKQEEKKGRVRGGGRERKGNGEGGREGGIGGEKGGRARVSEGESKMGREIETEREGEGDETFITLPCAQSSVSSLPDSDSAC